MRRFLDQKPDVVLQESAELTMEDLAKMKIREKLLETAVIFGVFLNLTENAPANPPPDPLAPYIDVLKGEEGFRTKAYKDTKGIPTIGVGFNLTRPDTESVFKTCFGDQCGDVLSRARDRNRGMTEAEVERLTRHDLENTFLPRVQKLVKGFDEMPEGVRTALLSSTWRGSLGGSPKTLALINAGKGADAAAEYLRNAEYEKSKREKTGIAGRMEREAEGMRLIGAAAPTPAPKLATASPPAATAAPAPKPAQPATSGYKISAGDTLSGIAKKHGKSVEDVMRANPGIKDPNKIRVGDSLILP